MSCDESPHPPPFFYGYIKYTYTIQITRFKSIKILCTLYPTVNEVILVKTTSLFNKNKYVHNYNRLNTFQNS